MEDQQPKKAVIALNLTDSRLGVANVLIALHLTKQIDLDLMLPELEKLTALTSYGEEKSHSSFSRSLAADLQGPLAHRWRTS